MRCFMTFIWQSNIVYCISFYDSLYVLLGVTFSLSPFINILILSISIFYNKVKGRAN